jgi:hypothetical protein
MFTFDEMIDRPKIYIALPVMDEAEPLPSCLYCIESQSYTNYHVVICVNQPDEWWDVPEKMSVCESNKRILTQLKIKHPEKYTVIDKSSKGHGWKGNITGVGWARKTIMDHIAKIANIDDIIVSLDADTIFTKNYFRSIIEIFNDAPGIVTLANPYYHELSGSEAEDRAILRYEIYMRNYAINLLLINSPYAFTALGSAIALPVTAYKAIGGLTPKLSGEDFYFLQKLRKYGSIRIHNTEKVLPAARFSDRVLFGTGPAMIKGSAGDWTSYPVYHHSLFNDIRKTYDLFKTLYSNDVQTPLTIFLSKQFKTEDIWQPIRNNHNDAEHFIRACHEKLDGLRILQYLKTEQLKHTQTDERNLYDNIIGVFKNIKNFDNVLLVKYLSFKTCRIDLLDEIRNYLAKVEESLQANCPQI